MIESTSATPLTACEFNSAGRCVRHDHTAPDARLEAERAVIEAAKRHEGTCDGSCTGTEFQSALAALARTEGK